MLVDSAQVIVDIYNQTYGESANAERIRQFDMLDECARLGEVYDGDSQRELSTYLASDDYWNNLQPKLDAFKVMEQLKSEGFELIMVTSGDAVNVSRKAPYASKLFPYFDGYLYLSPTDKAFSRQDINMDECFYIDDSATFLLDSNARTKIMFGKETKGNRNPGFFITKNWEGLYRYIHQIYEANTN